MACLNPIFIPDKSKKIITSEDECPLGYFVPCGQCEKCFKSRQNDIACRIAREAAERGNMIFVTFTYRDDTLPVACRLCRVDKSTGECFYDCKAGHHYDDKTKSWLPNVNNLLEPGYLLDSIRDKFSRIKAGRKSRLIIQSSPFFETEEDCYLYEFAPSLNRRDIRLWLKRSRINYLRHFKVPLPDFSYCIAGEYGTKSCRPHFHACFMGLTYEQVQHICLDWEERFGFVFIEAVKRINKDGSSGLLAAARYIGKYMSKGKKIECDSVLSGHSEAPRLCTSKRMGTKLSDVEIAYYSCWDLYGPYDPERLCFFDKTPLNSIQIQTLQNEIYKRSFITVDAHRFVLPRAIRTFLWKRFVPSEDYVYDKDIPKNPAASFRSFKIRRLAADASSRNLLAVFDRQLEAYIAQHPERETSALVREFITLQKIESENKVILGEKNHLLTYSNSIF